MADNECIIGLLYRTDNAVLCTLQDLEQHVEDRKEMNEFIRKCCPDIIRKDWSMKDYFDRRKSTDLTRFSFCPVCGKKIDWNGLRKSYG